MDSFRYVPADVQKVVADGDELHFYINDGPVSGVPRHEVARFDSAESMGKKMRELTDKYIAIVDADGLSINKWDPLP